MIIDVVLTECFSCRASMQEGRTIYSSLVYIVI